MYVYYCIVKLSGVRSVEKSGLESRGGEAGTVYNSKHMFSSQLVWFLRNGTRCFTFESEVEFNPNSSFYLVLLSTSTEEQMLRGAGTFSSLESTLKPS